MVHEFIHPQCSRHCICEVCERVISYHEYLQINDLDYVVCSSFECKRIMSQKSRMVPVLFKSYLECQKKLMQKRREEAAIRKQYREEVTLKERKENKKILQSILNTNAGISRKNTHLVNLPIGLLELTTPSSERIASYRKHLRNIIKSAFESFAEDNSESEQKDSAYIRLLKVEKNFIETPHMQTISNRVCNMCKGGCCPAGKEHAYLSAQTIKQFMKLKPNISQEKILDHYLSKVSSKTIDGACINQTKTGCTLPREMRSDICNGYYCDALISYHEKQAGNEIPINVIAVQRSHNNWNRFDPDVDNKVIKVALLEEEGSHALDKWLQE